MRNDVRHLYGVSRRDLLAAGGAALAVGLLPPTPAAGKPDPGEETLVARGSVFEEERDRDRGVAGVMVSNGEDVTITDANGRWELPVGHDDTLFVIKPPHWALSRRPGCFSNFSHRLGLSAGMPARDIDFRMRRTPENSRFEALLFADVQTATTEELGFARDVIVRNLAGSGAAFVINHGDVMGGDLSLYPAYRDLIADTGLVWHHCPGNHDMNMQGVDPRFAFETWRNEIGPTHYAFQQGQATFLVLNSVERVAEGRGYRGLIGARQLRFVENVLRHVPEHHLVVVSMHIPLTNFEHPDSATDTVADRAELMRLLSGRRHTVSFAGHSHTTEHHYLGLEAGFTGATPHHHHILTAASGSWWSGVRDERGIPISDSRDGTPKGFHVLTVDGNTYATRFVPFDRPAAAHMRVLLSRGEAADGGLPPSSTVGAAQLPRLHLMADVFDGGPRTRVTFEVEGGGQPPVDMQRVPATDPFIVETFARHASLNKPWVKAAISSHMWTAPLSAPLAGGRHRIVVRATGEFGATYESGIVLEVLA